MQFRILEKLEKDKTINSFLTTASEAHSNRRQSSEWFQWKFWENPDGASIMAVAEEEEEVVGCVAFGVKDFSYKNQMIKGAYSFETFVSPKHRRKGIFKKLISLAVDEAQKRGIQLLINFPNSNSLAGFVKSKWRQLSMVEYWIKPINWMRMAFNIIDLKSPFVPNPQIESPKVDLSNFPFSTIPDLFESDVSPEYFKWRFLSYPVSEYKVINNEEALTVVRMGSRGKLKEAQILLVLRRPAFKGMQRIIKDLCKETKFDLIGIPMSNNNPLKNYLKSPFYLKVPNNTNTTILQLDQQLKLDEKNIMIKGIDFHTY